MNTDPIADMLSRIRNAIAVNRNVVRVPFSKLKHNIASLLQDAGFLSDVSIDDNGPFKEIIITINAEDENAKITGIERVSKPGRRLYAKADDIPRVMSGRGVMIVSTSRGIMTDKGARQQRMGGELMVKVY